MAWSSGSNIFRFLSFSGTWSFGACSFLAFGLLFILTGPSIAHADFTIASQTDATVKIDNGYTGNNLTRDLGTGITGIPTYLFLVLERESGMGTSFQVLLQCFTDAGYSISCATAQYQYTYGTIPANTKTNVVVNFQSPDSGTPPVFGVSNYYRLVVTSPGGGLFPSGGSPAAGFRAFSYGSANSSPGTNSYFILNGSQDTTATRIVEETSPGNGGTTLSTSVTFTFKYFFNDTADFGRYDQAGVQIEDESVFQESSGVEQAIVASGYSTYTAAKTLTTGHLFLWRGYLRGISSGQYVYGPWQSFAVVTNPGGVDLTTLSGSTTVASSTDRFSEILIGLGNAIANNPPFGFVFQIKAALSQINASSTPARTLNIPDFEKHYVFDIFDFGMSGIEFLVYAVWMFKRFTHQEL